MSATLKAHLLGDESVWSEWNRADVFWAIVRCPEPSARLAGPAVVRPVVACFYWSMGMVFASGLHGLTLGWHHVAAY